MIQLRAQLVESFNFDCNIDELKTNPENPKSKKLSKFREQERKKERKASFKGVRVWC